MCQNQCWHAGVTVPEVWLDRDVLTGMCLHPRWVHIKLLLLVWVWLGDEKWCHQLVNIMFCLCQMHWHQHSCCSADTEDWPAQSSTCSSCCLWSGTAFCSSLFTDLSAQCWYSVTDSSCAAAWSNITCNVPAFCAFLWNCCFACPVRAPGCKNRPAPFPGQMSYKATKPGLVLFYILACFNCIVAY